MAAVTGTTDPGRSGEDPADRPGRPVGRRVVLAGGLAATAALAASCTIGGSDGGPGDGTDSGTDSGTDGQVTGAHGGTAAPGVVVALADVPVGGAVAAQIGGRPGIVARPARSTVAAFSALCTHRGCTVLVDGARLLCPCHGSAFDALTGEVLRGPATQRLPPIAVHLSGDEVVAG